MKTKHKNFIETETPTFEIIHSVAGVVLVHVATYFVIIRIETEKNFCSEKVRLYKVHT